MNHPLVAAVADAAVHAIIAQRCQRAYVHELRNGLQGIYASVDVLKRYADGKASANLQLDKVKDLARKALQAHDAELSRTVERVTLPKDDPAQVEVPALLREVCAFLANDAAARNVSLNFAAPDALLIAACPNRLRSAVLGIVIGSIDSVRGPGELRIGASNSNGVASIEATLLSHAAELRGEDFWIVDTPTRVAGSWLWKAMQDFVHRDGGRLDSKIVDPNEQRGMISENEGSDAKNYSVGRVVRLSYPAARPSTAE